MKQEIIVCAANKVETLTEVLNGIYAGVRHSNCFASMKKAREAYGGPDEDGLRITMLNNCIQGFLTNKNRFVTREEALQIAIDAGQVDETWKHPPKNKLLSEDLY